MHGLVNRSLESFARDFYGDARWGAIIVTADVGADRFEAMLHYPDEVTERLIEAMSRQLGKSREHLLEDVGHYLVSHPNSVALRRLMRLSGETFMEFVQSVDLLPDRARLALPDLSVPAIELADHGDGTFTLCVGGPIAGVARVLGGILTAMADDYGALVTLDYRPPDGSSERLEIAVHDAAFAEGRSFSLVDGSHA